MSKASSPDLILVRTAVPEDGFFSFSESLGLGYLASYLRQEGWNVEILDGQLDALDADAIAGRVLAANPLAVGFSIILDGYEDARTIARRLQEGHYPGHVTVGQHFATFNAERILRDNPRIDSVVRFEGEITAAELLRALRAGRSLDGILGVTFRGENAELVHNPVRPLIEDLDSLPFPARDLLARQPERITTYNISGSRGCPWRCKFCTVTSFYKIPQGKIWRHRSPARIVDEMQEVLEEFGTRPFNFVDDQFMGGGKVGREFARTFAREILERGLDVSFALETRADTIDRTSFELLRDAGLRLVFLGIESGYQPTLDLYQKDITVEKNMAAIRVLQDLDLEIQMGFIMFHQGTTLEEIGINLGFLEQTDAFDALPFFNELIVHAGSEFMDEMGDQDLNADYERNWVIEDREARKYKERLQQVLLPLTVPAQELKFGRRFGALTSRDVKELEAPIRRTFLGCAKELLAATSQGSVGETTLEAMQQHCSQEAARIQTSIRVRELTRKAPQGELRANWLAAPAP